MLTCRVSCKGWIFGDKCDHLRKCHFPTKRLWSRVIPICGGHPWLVVLQCLCCCALTDYGVYSLYTVRTVHTHTHTHQRTMLLHKGPNHMTSVFHVSGEYVRLALAGVHGLVVTDSTSLRISNRLIPHMANVSFTCNRLLSR